MFCLMVIPTNCDLRHPLQYPSHPPHSRALAPHNLPVGTWRDDNVIITSKRRRNIVLTQWWRYYKVMCPLGYTYHLDSKHLILEIKWDKKNNTCKICTMEMKLIDPLTFRSIGMGGYPAGFIRLCSGRYSISTVSKLTDVSTHRCVTGNCSEAQIQWYNDISW